jgi:hypothetical protein
MESRFSEPFTIPTFLFWLCYLTHTFVILLTYLEHIIPSLAQILHEAINDEKHCIYVAFEGRVPWNDDKHFDYIHPMEQVLPVTVSTRRKCKKSQEPGHL